MEARLLRHVAQAAPDVRPLRPRRRVAAEDRDLSRVGRAARWRGSACSVVLPAPLGPSRPVIPCPSTSETPSSARVAPRRLQTPSARTIVGIRGPFRGRVGHGGGRARRPPRRRARGTRSARRRGTRRAGRRCRRRSRRRSPTMPSSRRRTRPAGRCTSRARGWQLVSASDGSSQATAVQPSPGQRHRRQAGQRASWRPARRPRGSAAAERSRTGRRRPPRRRDRARAERRGDAGHRQQRGEAHEQQHARDRRDGRRRPRTPGPAPRRRARRRVSDGVAASRRARCSGSAGTAGAVARRARAEARRAGRRSLPTPRRAARARPSARRRPCSRRRRAGAPRSRSASATSDSPRAYAPSASGSTCQLMRTPSSAATRARIMRVLTVPAGIPSSARPRVRSGRRARSPGRPRAARATGG